MVSRVLSTYMQAGNAFAVVVTHVAMVCSCHQGAASQSSSPTCLWRSLGILPTSPALPSEIIRWEIFSGNVYCQFIVKTDMALMWLCLCAFLQRICQLWELYFLDFGRHCGQFSSHPAHIPCVWPCVSPSAVRTGHSFLNRHCQVETGWQKISLTQVSIPRIFCWGHLKK